MKRAMVMLAALALAALPGCGLLFSADDHVGGGGGMDGGPVDAAIDASDEPTDGGDADGGTDAGPPPPPECTTSAECGAVGLVQCVNQRCQFCATPESDTRAVRESANVRAQIALAFGTRAAGPPLVHVATFGNEIGVASEWHRFELSGNTIETRSIDDAQGDPCSGEFLPLGGTFRDDGGGSVLLGYLEGRPTSTDWQFVRWSESTVPRHSAMEGCRGVTAPEILYGPLVATDVASGLGRRFVARVGTAAGPTGLTSVEDAYANRQVDATITGLTADPITHIPHANGFVAVSTADRGRVMFWKSDEESTLPGGIDTPGRTTDAALAVIDADDLLMAFGAGDRIRIVPVHCDGGRCDAMGESVDVRTDGAVVSVVRIVMSNATMPLVLSVEARDGGNDQVVLRALRPSRVPWDAPGGGRALVLDTAADGEEIVDAQLVTTGTGATAHHAAAWVRRSSPTRSSVLARPFAGACDP
ncbi:hypothetical protein [Sandaracinus amylolyticus]|uniref:Uncharacterized protein n=1 Tax=Sandaracinus amylolyticus TaxID=927083 RepID=A0A0F6SDK0_9BACT|nr:hypothetical protein [Sandaracinus amylolyticus]AKF03579.1 hypothetical protein DB32_000728 [Sandaracinus amylolyticus]